MYFIILLSLILLSLGVDSIRWGITPMPTSQKAKKVVLDCLTDGKVYELGSGFGSLAFSISTHAASVVAYEASFFPYLISKIFMLFRRRFNLRILRKNFFCESLKDADVIVCYLYPYAMRRLKEKFEKELKGGARVISNSFAVPGWKADKIVEVDDLFQSKIYVYTRSTSILYRK